MFSTKSITASDNVNAVAAGNLSANSNKAPPVSDTHLNHSLVLASDLSARYKIHSLAPLLKSCRAALNEDEIPVAILGRFKAGKSSFINHFSGRNILPVGVVPVTTVITELRYGSPTRAEVHFLGDGVDEVALEDVRLYVSERENPENQKAVDFVRVELPELERFRGLKFIDTPGLESALAHNTETALAWLPNVGLALVAISVDPPLSQRDIELLRTLYKYTPNVSILLTKVDLLRPEQYVEVLEFIEKRLKEEFDSPPPVWPYSVFSGHEELSTKLKDKLVQGTLSHLGEQHHAIVARKIGTLLTECSDYLKLSLRSAELLDSEREKLKAKVTGEKQVIADLKSELRLIANHAASGTRSAAEARLETHRRGLESGLLAEFEEHFPSWTKSLAEMLDSYDKWLDDELRKRLAEISDAEQGTFVSRLADPSRQFRRNLQGFRDRLSDRTTRAFGVPLRTTEVEFEVHKPRTPDIRIGQIFDRNWELLSPVLPVWLIRGLVRHHFAQKIPDMVYKNLSRLASQWEEAINEALFSMKTEAEGRLEELMTTIEGLITEGSSNRVAEIKWDLGRIASVQTRLKSDAP